MPWRRVLAAAAAVPLLTASQNVGPSPTVDLLVSRAGAYVVRFEAAFANVVAEESYVQHAPKAVALTSGEVKIVDVQRDLKSDFLFVKVPAGHTWMPFRDVFSVDGHPVRDRQERLTRLFLQPGPTALEQARQVVADSTRYNIGGITRDLDLPIVALLTLEPDNQRRFTFKALRRASTNVWTFDFAEVLQPTLVRGDGGHDIPSHGRIWFDMSSEAVVKTELWAEDSTIHVHQTTTYRVNPAFGIAIPAQMEEFLEVPATGARVTGVAKYGNLRRFNVKVTESIGQP